MKYWLCAVLVVVLPLACLPATPKAGQRRMAEAIVESCVSSSRCQRSETIACHKEAEQWCRAHGLERSCGEGGSQGVCRP